MSPQVSIRVGNASLSGGAALSIRRSLGPVAGVCELVLPNAMGASAEPGDPLVVSLGEDEDLARVFTGELESVRHEAGQVVLRGLDARAHLGRRRTNAVFEEQDSAQILSALAGEAALEVGPLAGGPPFPSYFVDDGRSLLAHAADLAALAGADLFVDVHGLLTSVAYEAPRTLMPLRHGADLLMARSLSRVGGGAVEVRSEGAASTHGRQAALWPVTDTAQVAGRAGDGGPARRGWEPSLRSKRSAERLADRRAQRRARTQRRTWVRVLGRAGVELTQAVELRSLPHGPDETLLVAAIDHRLDTRRGFVSELLLVGPGTSPAQARAPSPLNLLDFVAGLAPSGVGEAIGAAASLVGGF